MAPDAVYDTERPERNAAQHLTPKERRRRYILLVLLLLLLAMLAYGTYYFTFNKRLPISDLGAPTAAVQPPQYLYSITGSGADQLGRPVGVDIAPDGRVYVVDFNNRRVSVFTNQGDFLFSFNEVDEGTLTNPVHLVIQGEEVWVTDRRHRALFVFDLEGQFLRKFTPDGEDDIEWGPLALTFSPEGELRVTDVGESDNHRLVLFSADGSVVRRVGSTVHVNSVAESPGGFLFPNGLAVAEDGRIFVSDGDNRRVQVFSRSGEYLSLIDTSGVPRGVAIDSRERLYVVNAIAHTVDVYDLQGRRLTQFGERGFGPGQFNYPNNVAIDNGGRIYVTDRENNQVQVWGWPVAQPPAVPLPTSPTGWLACLLPLLLLPLLLLMRKIRIVVTPQFVDSLIAAGHLTTVARRRRLRLVVPEEDMPLYEGREVEGVKLTDVLYPEPFSESDAKAIEARLGCTPREAMLLAMSSRVKALGTNDTELRRLAVLIEQRAVSMEEFSETYLTGRS